MPGLSADAAIADASMNLPLMASTIAKLRSRLQLPVVTCSGLIDAINAQSATTGVTATYAEGSTTQLVLTDADGDNIKFC